MDDGRLLPFLALVVVGATSSLSAGSRLRGTGPAPSAPSSRPSFEEALRQADRIAKNLSGPRLKAGSVRSILAWLRWNDPDGHYPAEYDDVLDVDEARRMLVSVFAEDAGSLSRRGSRLRRVAPVPREQEDPFLRGKVLMTFQAALKRSFDIEAARVHTTKGWKDWVQLDAIGFDEIVPLRADPRNKASSLQDLFPGLDLGSFSFSILYTTGPEYTFRLHDDDRSSMMGQVERFGSEDVTRFLNFLIRSSELIFDARGVSPYVFETGDRVFISKNVDSSFKGRYGTVTGRNVYGGYGTPFTHTAEGEPAYLVQTSKSSGALWFRDTDLRRTKR